METEGFYMAEKRWRTWETVGLLVVLAAGNLLHFIYDWTGQSPIAAPLAAVNESTWEHMKLLFFPALLFTMVQLAAAKELAAKVQDSTVLIKAKGGASGRLAGKITVKEVAAALSSQVGSEIDRRKVELEKDIKDFGSYGATVKLHPGVSASFKVKVEEQA